LLLLVLLVLELQLVLLGWQQGRRLGSRALCALLLLFSL